LLDIPDVFAALAAKAEEESAISHDFLKTSFSPHVLRGGSIFAF
jgi:hypothetical protein